MSTEIYRNPFERIAELEAENEKLRDDLAACRLERNEYFKERGEAMEEIAKLKNQLTIEYIMEYVLMREKVCDKCGGRGIVAYSDTTMWRGGIGGQMITPGPCDKCWGTGDLENKGVDLRKLDAIINKRNNELKTAHEEVADLKCKIAALEAQNERLRNLLDPEG